MPIVIYTSFVYIRIMYIHIYTIRIYIYISFRPDLPERTSLWAKASGGENRTAMVGSPGIARATSRRLESWCDVCIRPGSSVIVPPVRRRWFEKRKGNGNAVRWPGRDQIPGTIRKQKKETADNVRRFRGLLMLFSAFPTLPYTAFQSQRMGETERSQS